MKNRIAIIAAATLFLAATVKLGAAQQNAENAPQQLKVEIDTQQSAQPVSRYEYGMFIEHIGALIYRSLWSQMLDDRKFYFPIKPEEPQAATPAQGGPFRNMQLRKWLPIGPAEAIVMDNDHPFVGEQSPRIELDASTPHGIRQSGFSLVKGKKYSGHIWLRATPGVKVRLSVAWGQGANGRKMGRSDYVMVAALTLIFSIMTSYARARAESLVEKCKVGFMERPERIVLLMIGASTNRMAAVLWVILLLSILAVANRIYYTYLVLNGVPMPTREGVKAYSTGRSSGPTSARRCPTTSG